MTVAMSLREAAPAVILVVAAAAAPGLAIAQAPASIWNSAIMRRPAAWYGSSEARAVAEQVLAYQSAEGGWPKNTPLDRPPTYSPEVAAALSNTIDNEATTTPIAFLARVGTASGETRFQAAALRGLDYLLAAQGPGGGWPQYFPLRGGYYDRITYNDDAMIRVMTLLRQASLGGGDYAFMDAERRRAAGRAVERGTEVILKTQVRVDGRLTVWCAQHDPQTLTPAWARAFEPPSLSGNESVGIVRFLMAIETPSPEVVAAVEAAVAWFEASAIIDRALETFTDEQGRTDIRLKPQSGAPRLWARFYDLETGRPIYIGRDSVLRPNLSDIEYERRNGYRYVGTWPERLLTEDYPAWRRRLPQPTS